MLQPPSLSLAVEEEYQWIDPPTGELRGFLLQRLTDEGMVWREFDPKKGTFRDEIVGSIVRMSSLTELESLLQERRYIVKQRAERRGYQVMVAGTHPFTSWHDPVEALSERFRGTVGTLDAMISRLLFFGLTVQIGVEDRNFAVDVMDVARYMMPHVLAISASSPFWRGEDTGLQSFRATLLENVPRTGVPDRFRTWSAYHRFLQSMLKTHSMNHIADIWWDVQVHPTMPVVEFRIADANPRLDDVLAFVALFQALVAWLWDLRRRNLSFRIYHGDLIQENRWRAARYGLDTKLIDFGKEREFWARSLLREFLYLLTGYAEQLDSWTYLERIYSIVELGNSATRQLRVYRETHSLHAVVNHLVQETTA
ncbi:MAG: YbdK family carboxylate-amine ligase [Chloroflexi bacterium]|nr:YbdK family carboxylate-amine ligase [Chloroflexota bacterium]